MSLQSNMVQRHDHKCQTLQYLTQKTKMADKVLFDAQLYFHSFCEMVKRESNSEKRTRNGNKKKRVYDTTLFWLSATA